MKAPQAVSPEGDACERAARQGALFADATPVVAPVIASYGAGVDSTAMLIDMIEAGERVDHVLFADTGSEKLQTYQFLELFRVWLAERGVPLTVVRYRPQSTRHFPLYETLDENCLTNATLPSIAFGRGACSQKWKAEPQHRWTLQHTPAQIAWAAGLKVVKLIGYDCSGADQRRFAEANGKDDPLYEYRYPLRDRGWTRDDCKARIRAAGLPVPPKSACFMCTATKPDELHEMAPGHLRRIVLMEARAKPRLRGIEGLWRRAVEGKRRGSTPRPGSMTQYIREQGLLPAHEIDAIIAAAPMGLTPVAGVPLQLLADDEEAAEHAPGCNPIERAAWEPVFLVREAMNEGTGRELYRGIAA